ncbi:MAG: adenosylcobinamide-phosphate synthase CbiB [Pseudomonadota bacterium]
MGSELWASPPAMMLLALLLEAAIGWPQWLYRSIKHPVVWIGALASKLERALNRPRTSATTRRVLGAAATLAVIGVAAACAGVVLTLTDGSPLGLGLQVFLASGLIASRSLYVHVAAVVEPLARNDLVRARSAVAQIVGRDPSVLDEAGVARASLESLAENTSDGVVAPLFWGALFGLPGLATYKAINTLDSMYGHKTERLAAFGYFAARLDDLANLVPARFTGLLIVLAGFRWQALSVMFRDARKHRSPNAGWPEAAMAGALNRRLSGPRVYADEVTHEPWLNRDAADPEVSDVQQGLSIYRRTVVFTAALLLAWTVLP